jgi:hypothetical protein
MLYNSGHEHTMQILEDLSVESVVFELRYKPAYLLWDSVGGIWSKVVELNPSLESTTAQPNTQVFSNQDLQMTLELGQLKVATRGPKALELLIEKSKEFYDITTRILDVSTFTRAGFRIIRSKSFNDRAAIIKYADPQTPIPAPGTDKPAEMVGFQNTVRYEAETFGILATLRNEDREINVNMPWEVLPYTTSISKKMPMLIADADYYTIGLIEKDLFDVGAWINQANKAIRRQLGAI